ncbi:hypothetical protein UFOVP815_2 [uncultured Caudovirales phage]|uniref:Uncharacterized protein n=1 Tax=uncultured Caudovirales phage TaxID=2100421 RepID=A0A6J5NZ89_9CAUD|nr:hypothetical protein UFOVP815_2 [uncultured Caudovirales phage]
MRKTEQKLWDRMRAAKVAVPSVRLERIENLVGVGTPDVIALCKGQVTWVELKSVDNFPVKETTRVLGAKGLSVAQRNWHYEWYAHEGRSLILVGVGRAQIYTIPGFLADAVNDMSRAELGKNSIADSWTTLFDHFGVYQ